MFVGDMPLLTSKRPKILQIILVVMNIIHLRKKMNFYNEHYILFKL